MLKLQHLIAAFSATALLMFPQVGNSRPVDETAGYPVVLNPQVNSMRCYMRTQSGVTINLGRLCGEVDSTSDKGVFQAPIKRRVGGVPVIDVTFNGTQKFEMLVDTGASETALTQQVATALGIVPIGTVKTDTASDKGVEVLVGHIASIEVAGAIVKDTSITVSPALDTGLLGENFFGLYDVTVKENVVEFRPRQR